MAEALSTDPQESSCSLLEDCPKETKETNCQQYELHLKKEDNDLEYEKTAHVISMVNQKVEGQRMFFDHHEIHENNFTWHNKVGINFHQGSDDSFIGGDFAFNPNNQTALGSFQQGATRKQALLVVKPAVYNVALSKDAGTSAEGKGVGIKLNWNVDSTIWKGAHWSEKELEYSYQITQGPLMVGKPTATFNVTFVDNETKVEWKVNNEPNIEGKYANITVSQNDQIVFDKNTAKKPADSHRTDTHFPKIFPDQMVVKMNDFGSAFNGAMSIGTDSKTATVYAVHGTAKNASILGQYMLYSNGRPHSTFAVSNGKMLVNEKHVANSGVHHNTLWWKDMAEEHSEVTGLPKEGTIDFSKDGSKGLILRKSNEEPLITVKPRTLLATQSLAATNLNIYALLSMDPNVKSKDGTSDVVQEDAMQDFYKIIQYYMDSNLRHDFISLNPPDMTGIRNIAEDDQDKNRKFYGFLSTPYLTQALSNSTQTGSNELNGIRASKMLNKGFLYNKDYKEAFQSQTQQLYTLHFEKHFSLFSAYLTDQKTNYRQYSQFIQNDSAKWITEIEGQKTNSTGDESSIQNSVNIIKRLTHKALQEKLYWAYAMFRYITSPYYVSWLQSNMLNPNNSSQTLSLSIKKYVTLLQMLDPSSEFTVEFLQFIKQFQFLNILPQLLNLQELSTDFNTIMNEIMEKFIKEHVDSKDSDMNDAANALQIRIRKNNLRDYLQVFKTTLRTNLGANWAELVDNFNGSIAQKLGKAALKVADLFATGMGVLSIVFVISGTVKWSDMSKVDQTSFVTLSYILFEKLTTKIVKGILKARAAFVASGGSWGETIQTYFLGKWQFSEEPASYLESGFAKWISKTKGPGGEVGGIAMNVAENSEEVANAQESISKMEFAFGKNLDEFLATRVAAVFAVINIVISAIELSQSDSGMEKAMNALFLASGFLELVTAVGGWALSVIPVESATTLATVFGLAAAFSLVTAVAGGIILIVILATHTDPQTPLQKFVQTHAANSGYRMEKGVAIDYFQVTKVKGQADTIGVSLSGTSDTTDCIKVHSDKTLHLGALSHGSDTVWEINTDQFGYAKFATFVYSDNGTANGVFIKLKDGKIIAEGASGSNNTNEQKWICDIQDKPKYTTIKTTVSGNDIVQRFLTSGTFTIRNVASDKNKIKDYLNVENGKLVVNSTPKKWVLKMQGMKPSHLSMQSIKMNQYDHTLTYYPTLIEAGSKYGTEWTLTPSLPDFLKFHTKTGEIKQVKDTANFPSTTFTLTVKNNYGSTDTTFKIEASIDSS